MTSNSPELRQRIKEQSKTVADYLNKNPLLLMTDILDDTYESDLTEEEHERLILMSEHAVAPPWSPLTSAVWRAFKDAPECAEVKLAAALRAAAYRVAPARPVLDSCCEHYEQAIRHKLLAIASELESQ